MDIGMNDINALYTLWREKAVLDPDLKAELDAVAGQEDEVLDRFYRNLAFGYGRAARRDRRRHKPYEPLHG